MRHVRFDLAHLTVEGVDLPLRMASVVVVDQPGTDGLAWECLAYALDPAPLAPGRYRLGATTLAGRQLDGEAVLVRSVEGAHVLRGDGPLAGVVPTDLG